MLFALWTLILGLLAIPSAHAFIGISIEMYNPSCAFACRTIISSAMLDCPSDHGMDHGGHRKRHGHTSSVTPACRAVSVPFLTTLAYCINEKCYPEYNPPKSKIEWYFAERATGDSDRKLEPMWSYGEALAAVNGTPTAMYSREEMVLNETMLVDRDEWLAEKESMEWFWWQETLNSRYSITIVSVLVGLPVFLFMLQNLPYGRATTHWLSAKYLHPALWRGHVVQPVAKVFNPPTLGQGWYIGFMIVFTTVFAYVETHVQYPNTWWDTATEQAQVIIGNRAGCISLALMPVTILFAGRNNFLLWITGWSHSTYLLMHRWVARLCVLHAVLHSLIWLAVYVTQGRDVEKEQKELYWIWGAVATVAGVVILLASQARRYYYEIFLITHILLVVFFIAGVWYHLEYLYKRYWGYEAWIYACAAVWFFDRLLRVWRTVKNGAKDAHIIEIGQEIVRIDIPAIRWSTAPGQHAYIFLPALRKWAPWENHPFSVIPTVMLKPRPDLAKDTQRASITPVQSLIERPEIEPAPASDTTPSSSSNSTHKDLDLEKSHPSPALHSAHTGHSHNHNHSRPRLAGDDYTTKGITLYIRRQTGLTASFLASHSRLSSVLDGPYKDSYNSSILNVDRLIIIAGGIGITAVLPFAPYHSNSILHWGMRQAQREMIGELEHGMPVERNVVVGERINVREAIEREVRDGWKLIGVVVCGPGGMCDDVRKEVVRLGRMTTVRFELDVEAFNW